MFCTYPLPSCPQVPQQEQWHSAERLPRQLHSRQPLQTEIISLMVPPPYGMRACMQIKSCIHAWLLSRNINQGSLVLAWAPAISRLPVAAGLPGADESTLLSALPVRDLTLTPSFLL